MAQKQNKVRLEARAIKFGLINAKISWRTLSVNRGNVAQGYMLYPPSPTTLFTPQREQYALQPILFFLPDLRYHSTYPDIFVNGVVPCPNCRTSLSVKSNGFAPGRRVVGLHSTYVLIGRSYTCTMCQKLGRKHTFRPWHPGVLAAMPRQLRDEFSVVCTHKICVEAQMLTALNVTINDEGTYAGFRRLVAELHAEEFVRRGTQYLHHLHWQREHSSRNKTIEHSFHNGDSPHLPWYEDPFDRNGYGDYVPSAEFWQELHLRFLEERDVYEHRSMQQIDGTILSMDASHKVTQLVYVSSTTKVYHGLLTVMNQYVKRLPSGS